MNEAGFGVIFRPFGSVVEHSLGKGEVAGPIPAKGTKNLSFKTLYFPEQKHGKREI
jgi:hypothetical protein